MKLLFSVSIVLLLCVTGIFANERPAPGGWEKNLAIDITTTQTSYSDSWVGGEAGSFNWVSNLNGLAERQFSPTFHFKSTLKMSFGQTTTQDAETKKWSRPKKSTDLIDWENVGRFTFGGFVDPYVAFRLETQFFDARKVDQKMYFSPMRLTESAGLARVFHKTEKNELTSRLGFALRQNMKSDIDSVATPGTYTQVDSTLTDGGLECVTDAKFQFSEKVGYIGKLTLYKAFYFSKSDEVKGTEYENNWKAIDANWENIIGMQVSKVMAVLLYTQVLYDKEISKKARIKETIAVGFVFKLM